jgi:hypothetical protein
MHAHVHARARAHQPSKCAAAGAGAGPGRADLSEEGVADGDDEARPRRRDLPHLPHLPLSLQRRTCPTSLSPFKDGSAPPPSLFETPDIQTRISPTCPHAAAAAAAAAGVAGVGGVRPSPFVRILGWSIRARARVRACLCASPPAPAAPAATRRWRQWLSPFTHARVHACDHTHMCMSVRASVRARGERLGARHIFGCAAYLARRGATGGAAARLRAPATSESAPSQLRVRSN